MPTPIPWFQFRVVLPHLANSHLYSHQWYSKNDLVESGAALRIIKICPIQNDQLEEAYKPAVMMGQLAYSLADNVCTHYRGTSWSRVGYVRTTVDSSSQEIAWTTLGVTWMDWPSSCQWLLCHFTCTSGSDKRWWSVYRVPWCMQFLGYSVTTRTVFRFCYGKCGRKSGVLWGAEVQLKQGKYCCIKRVNGWRSRFKVSSNLTVFVWEHLCFFIADHAGTTIAELH